MTSTKGKLAENKALNYLTSKEYKIIETIIRQKSVKLTLYAYQKTF